MPALMFFGTLWVRVSLIAAALAGLVALRAWDVSTQQARGATVVVEASKKAGAEANVKSEKVRAAARQPGAFTRLRRDSCRDC